MTRPSLAELIPLRVFEPSPFWEDLAVYHCPFDDLVPGAHVESRLDEAVRNGGRAPLVGVSGSGKTSVTAHVLGPLAEGIAPVRVPVRDLDRDQVATPQVFQRHVLEHVGRVARHAEQLEVEDRDALESALARRVVIRDGRRRTHLGVPRWLLGGGELAVELERRSREVERSVSAAEVRDALRRVLRCIAAEGVRPVLLIDDTDSWLNVGDRARRSQLVGEFFGNVLRPIAELPCSIVVAVHKHYMDFEAVREATASVPDRVDVPALNQTHCLETILQRRLDANELNLRLADAVEASALAALWECYCGEASGSVRRVLDVAHKALLDAQDLGTDLVTLASVGNARRLVFDGS